MLVGEPADPDAERIDGVLAGRVARLRRASDAAALLARWQEEPWDVVVAAPELPGLGGRDLLVTLLALDPDARVVLCARRGCPDEAVRALRAGARHYLAKDVRLESRLPRVLEEAAAPRPETGAGTGFLGASREARRVRRRIEEAATCRAPVLVLGESGTGKEVVARSVHARSDRADGPFVAVNCAALPEALVEVELFGAVRGAYTGASRDRAGLVAAARDGTLFLDEVAELAPAAQAKLLRFLDGSALRPLGATREEVVDVRIVAATHRDLEAAVRRGAFREDLYFRLNVLRIDLAPLRERRADLAVLALHFAARASEGRRVTLTDRALHQLLEGDWPGNARQLQNAIQRAVVRGGARIEALDPTAGAPGSRALEDLLRTHAGDVSALAGVLGVSVRTVQRRLARAGLRAAAYRPR